MLKEINPNVVFSKGGFVSIPVAIAAKKLKIPEGTVKSRINNARKILKEKLSFLMKEEKND